MHPQSAIHSQFTSSVIYHNSSDIRLIRRVMENALEIELLALSIQF